jgi:hypothetical protein
VEQEGRAKNIRIKDEFEKKKGAISFESIF